MWASLDDATTRYLMMQQEDFVAEARGARISRWQTPFSFDVSFSANGRAWIYDTHLLPTWKKAGHWKQGVIDKMNALGTYSAMMLDEAHERTVRDCGVIAV